jgi:hypothetical protein
MPAPTCVMVVHRGHEHMAINKDAVATGRECLDEHS